MDWSLSLRGYLDRCAFAIPFVKFRYSELEFDVSLIFIFFIFFYSHLAPGHRFIANYYRVSETLFTLDLKLDLPSTTPLTALKHISANKIFILYK